MRVESEDAQRFVWPWSVLGEFLSSCLKYVDLTAGWLVVACERQGVFCYSAKGDSLANDLIAQRLAAFESRDAVNGCADHLAGTGSEMQGARGGSPCNREPGQPYD